MDDEAKRLLQQLVTKIDDQRADFRELRAEVKELRAEVKNEIKELRTEFKELRGEVKEGRAILDQHSLSLAGHTEAFRQLDRHLQQMVDIAELRGRVSELSARMPSLTGVAEPGARRGH